MSDSDDNVGRKNVAVKQRKAATLFSDEDDDNSDNEYDNNVSEPEEVDETEDGMYICVIYVCIYTYIYTMYCTFAHTSVWLHTLLYVYTHGA